MLKLLLSHWQAHREPLPFVLTDDPLYCSHLTKSPFPEVYSVNRVNPIFEDDEVEAPSLRLKRSLSEERRENETRASDDTGYSSSSHQKSATTADSLTDDVGSRRMSSDSDEDSHPEEVIVSVDVHRVSYPDDVIVPSSDSSHCSSHTLSANSYFNSSSDLSQDPFDSLTMSEESKHPNSGVREKLQRLLEKGNQPDLDSAERTKNDLIKSLTRVLSNKVPNGEDETVTRTDSALEDQQQAGSKSLDRKSTSSSTSPKTLYFSQNSSARDSGVTRQDESSASSSISFKPRKQRVHKHSHDKESKRTSTTSNQESVDAKKSHQCKLCENAHRPLAFHQLLPGHWSYDNVYLPQMSGVCYACMHHQYANAFHPSSEDDVFFPMYYHPPDVARARHSWAPYTNSRVPTTDHLPKRKRSSEDKSASTTLKDISATDSSDSSRLKKSLSERRSLREPKKCKCDHCLSSALDRDGVHLGGHTCPCHRRVKFASDSDVSQHRHVHSVPFRTGKDGEKLINGDPINAAFVMSLPHLNGHALKENGVQPKMPAVPRGLKEPIKMDELYRSYPINFREWESHYRRNFLQKRRKRALNMVGMAIGIILVVGVAVALTFVFLRIRRT